MTKPPKDKLLAYSHFNGNADLLRVAVVDANTVQGLNLSVSDLNERVIRYYATEGVIDKPDRVGRDAIYQFRHLLQILMCRLMQSEGFSIAQIAAFNQSTPSDDLRMRLITAQPRQATKAQDLIRQFRQGSASAEEPGVLRNRRAPANKPPSTPRGKGSSAVLYCQSITVASAQPENEDAAQTAAHSAARPIERQMERAAAAASPSIPAVDLHAALEGVRRAMHDVQRQTEHQHRELMERMHRAFQDIERIGEQMHHLEKEQRSATARLNEQMEKLLDAVDPTRNTPNARNNCKSGESR